MMERRSRPIRVLRSLAHRIVAGSWRAVDDFREFRLARRNGLVPTEAVHPEALPFDTDPVGEAHRLVLGRDPRDDERFVFETGNAANRSSAGLLIQLLESDEHRNLVESARFVPPGHFYSPLPSAQDAEAARHVEAAPDRIAGVDLRPRAQLQLLERFAADYLELPFTEQPSEGSRYHYGNPNFSYSDAIFLASMIRYASPRRIIEVGSGDSSCALLDVNETFFGGKLDLTFVEPYPEYLLSLLSPQEAESIRLLPTGLQAVDLSEFGSLQANDILFIDSTHVSKVGSDVNHLFFQVLPELAAGVYVHIHDVFGAFEYPSEWIDAGRAWTEQYILRAFLQYNSDFEIILFGNWAVSRYPEWFAEHMPLCLKNPGGSIWLRRR